MELTEAKKQRKYLLVIAGPTAVGKTALSVKIAQHFNTVVINADSRQIYKELQIGTAKPTLAEMEGIKHYFVDCLSLSEDYNAGKFEKDALMLLEKSFKKHDLVVLSGGSGMYIDAVCQGLDDFPEVPVEVRAQLEKELKTLGLEVLQKELEKKDPEYYQQIDIHNPRRITRALEIIRSSGEKFSTLRKKHLKERHFKIVKIGLYREREALYQRINKRMDQMLSEGLLDEAKSVESFKHTNALQTVGYKEIYGYLAGEYDWEETVRLLKRNTRRFAKRQMTWFRKDQGYTWFHPDQENEIIEHTETQIGKDH